VKLNVIPECKILSKNAHRTLVSELGCGVNPKRLQPNPIGITFVFEWNLW
jgi:hypothetical protein